MGFQPCMSMMDVTSTTFLGFKRKDVALGRTPPSSTRGRVRELHAFLCRLAYVYNEATSLTQDLVLLGSRVFNMCVFCQLLGTLG